MEQKLTLSEIKKIEIGILNYVADICKKNSLKYYLGYGTLLGAIRHKGFIPWDDDIDICMPRKDYDEFIKIIRAADNNRYKGLIPLEEPHYFYEFVKVIDKTTIVEDSLHSSFENGVWIDIFPLDGINVNDKLYQSEFSILHNFRVAAVNVSFPKKIKGIMVPIAFVLWKLCRLIGYKFFLKKLLNLSKKYDYSKCDYIGCFAAYRPPYKYLHKEWFAKTTLVDFEGNKYPAPAMYDEYLKSQYGDYMKLPPEEQRVSHNMEAFRK